MNPPPTDQVVLAGAWASSLFLGSVILRVRRDITGPPLSRVTNVVWIVSLLWVGLVLLITWLADSSDRWLFWPLAVPAVGFLLFVLWDTVQAVKVRRRTRQRPPRHAA